jgi:nicotinamidase-related amidase
MATWIRERISMPTNQSSELPLPAHFDPERVSQVWRVPYQIRALQASEWAERYAIQPAYRDEFRIVLLGIDIQNTFCIPEYELFVGGSSGRGAVDDNRRLVEFIYKNMHRITQIAVTMDTHQALQIFHPVFLVDKKGQHPEPLTLISVQDVTQGKWKFNPKIAASLGIAPEDGQKHLLHYTRELQSQSKFDLTIWPYHAILGGTGHALVSAFEEATFFHTLARNQQAEFILKGDNALTESYSAIGPEVLKDAKGRQIGEKSREIFGILSNCDALIIAGQAKSHCVSWTISDLLEDIRAHDPDLAQKVYLLEDCTSAVVVPGIVDYSDQADAEFERFAAAGMHRVVSSDPISKWPGMG